MSTSRFFLVILFILTMLFFKVKEQLMIVNQTEIENNESSENSKYIGLKKNKVLKFDFKDFPSKPKN